MEKEHPSTRGNMEITIGGGCMGDMFPTNNLFEQQPFDNPNFLINKPKIKKIVMDKAKERKQMVFGAHAMNEQLPLFFRRPTQDIDIISKQPKQRADEMQQLLDNKIAGGRDEFFVKPAEHEGTFKVRHQGRDGVQGTKDDTTIVDFTDLKQKPPSKEVNGVRMQTLSSMVDRKKEILKDPESAYRHDKDRGDIQRIKASKIFRGGII